MISFYTIALISAAIVVSVGSWVAGVRRGIPAGKLLSVILLCVVLTFVGSRWMYVVTSKSNPDTFWDLNPEGFSLTGGIIFSIIGGSIACYLFRINSWLLADVIAPFLGIGIAVVRVGCFLHGCCFGKETNFPWGVSFPIGSPAHLYQLQHQGGDLLFVHPVHPTQLYELAAGVVGTILATAVLRKKLLHGVAALVFSLWFTAFRWINSFFRVTPSSYTASPYLYPAIYLVSICVESFFLWKMLKK